MIILSLLSCWLIIGNDSTSPAIITLSSDRHGISTMSWINGTAQRNYVDSGKTLGDVNIKYRSNAAAHYAQTSKIASALVKNQQNNIVLQFQLPGGLVITERFHTSGNKISWFIDIKNKSGADISVTDLSFPIPLGNYDRKLPVQENLSSHNAIIGDASFLYWTPYRGFGKTLLMTPSLNTSLEFATGEWNNTAEVYAHASTSLDSTEDTWRLPVSSALIRKGSQKSYGFIFQLVDNIQQLRDRLYAEGALETRIAPGMTVPNDLSAFCLLRAKGNILRVSAENPSTTHIEDIGPRKHGYRLYKISFSRLGENMITVTYNGNRKGYLNFFSTEPLDVLMKKRSHFIASKQQHRDTSKWYNGLYSIWDMEQQKLLSPDNKGALPDFAVGGSDDPSNCKPLLIAEKNVIYPNREEIASLEYYQKNFVWGKLQRTGDEYPYPYGIYGSENWYENRSGKVAGYNSGGWGKERMWRTFDYVTHIAIYFNLYKIARDNPGMTTYLDANGYLERAYRTAMAFFIIPYNIEMGPKWAFHGWTDWAYKQGNFHERYIIELITELEKANEKEKADLLRREWEKKVKYFIYDDPWPFASEIEIDRTAFESSYYVAEYAKENVLHPQEQLWYDKNKKVWYSHLSISDSATNSLMQRQLLANLAIRGTIEPAFNLLGSAWAGTNYGLDYMSQMGGVAILDYALKFAEKPADFINIGYNSLLSSWALMNTGDKKSGFGYWYPHEKNDGAIGWIFSPRQKTTTYFQNIPAKRWVWQYDGEIDHGIVGAIHGSRSVVTDDPFFGRIGYGCELMKTANGDVAIIPRDGVRRRVYFYTGQQKISAELLSDGFAKNSPVMLSEDGQRMSFTIENRHDKSHECRLIVRNIDAGQYKVSRDGAVISSVTVTAAKSIVEIKLPINSATHQVSIVKQ